MQIRFIDLMLCGIEVKLPQVEFTRELKVCQSKYVGISLGHVRNTRPQQSYVQTDIARNAKLKTYSNF